MNFPFVLPEEDRIHAHISQRSQLKYIKVIFDKFDSSQQEQFRNSCFGHLTELAELQFSAQLMQQLLFRLVESGKINELWFNFNGHYSRFGLHEYAIVTGLKCGPPVNTEEYEKTLQKKRLKERYFKGSDRVTCGDLERVFLHSSTPRVDRYKLGLALLVEGVFIAPENNIGIDLNTLALVDNLNLFFDYPWGKFGYHRVIKAFKRGWSKKVQDAKAKQEKEIRYTIHGFPLAMQIWAYEAVPELGERFAERLGIRNPRILSWTAKKQPQQRTYEGFFKNTPLQVYASLRPLTEEQASAYISTLAPLEDKAVPVLDDLALNMDRPQCDVEENIASDASEHPSSENTESEDEDTESGSAHSTDSTTRSNDNETGEGEESSGPDRGSFMFIDRHDSGPGFENVGTGAFQATPAENESIPSTSQNEPSRSEAPLSRDDVTKLLQAQEKILKLTLERERATLMEAFKDLQQKLEEKILGLNETVMKNYQAMQRLVNGLQTEVRASCSSMESSSINLKEELQKYIAHELQDLKNFVKVQVMAQTPHRESEPCQDTPMHADEQGRAG